jgi:3-hydroxy-9,10-secoandrosta-1,3,5(10)-triene-9,17-dione monooxygenase reductase component
VRWVPHGELQDSAPVSQPSALPTPQPIDGAQYRHVLGHFLTGVTIITAIDPETGTPVGLAASSFTSVSMDPALVLFCAGNSSSSWPKIRAAGSYCVNILGAEQETLSRQFSRPGDKFAGVGWRTEATGAPVFTDALAWIDCTIHEVVEAGDHCVVIGAVQALGSRDHGGPLGYYRGGYGNFGQN